MVVRNQGNQKKVALEAAVPAKGDLAEVDAALTPRATAVDGHVDVGAIERPRKTLGSARGCYRFEPMGVGRSFLIRPVLVMSIFHPKI